MHRVDIQEAKKILRDSILFAELPEVDFVELASHAQCRAFKAREVIFAQNAVGSSLYWVTSGRVKISVNRPTGGELIYGMTEVGDYFGEVTVIDECVRGVNAIAVSRSTTISLDRIPLMSAFEKHPKVALTLTRLLCRQIRTACASIESLAFYNSEARIWTHLMHLAEDYGVIDPENGSMHIRHGLSQQNLADSVGLTRVMVNRQLSAWRELGLIGDGRGYLNIPDPQAFEAHVWRKSGAERTRREV